MRKLFKTKTGVIVSICLLALMVGVVVAAIAPRNETYRAAAKTYTAYGMAGTASAEVPIFVAPYPGYVTRVGILSVAGLANGDTVTNYHSWYFISKGTTGSATADTVATYTTLHQPTYTATTWPAYTVRMITCDSSQNYVSAGTVINAKYVKTSSPTSLGLTYYFIEFIPQGGYAPQGIPNTYKATDQ